MTDHDDQDDQQAPPQIDRPQVECCQRLLAAQREMTVATQMLACASHAVTLDPEITRENIEAAFKAIGRCMAQMRTAQASIDPR